MFKKTYLGSEILAKKNCFIITFKNTPTVRITSLNSAQLVFIYSIGWTLIYSGGCRHGQLDLFNSLPNTLLAPELSGRCLSLLLTAAAALKRPSHTLHLACTLLISFLNPSITSSNDSIPDGLEEEILLIVYHVVGCGEAIFSLVLKWPLPIAACYSFSIGVFAEQLCYASLNLLCHYEDRLH